MPKSFLNYSQALEGLYQVSPESEDFPMFSCTLNIVQILTGNKGLLQILIGI